jgi:hypothetical protein
METKKKGAMFLLLLLVVLPRLFVSPYLHVLFVEVTLVQRNARCTIIVARLASL